MASSTMKRFCATALLGLLLSTTAVPAIAQNLDELAARGEVLAGGDRLSAELRGRLDEAGRRGFDIGMGVAEKDTLPGPGKQRIHDQLPVDQQPGYASAVLFSITRNANSAAANVGARIADADSRLAAARRAEDDPFYALGFDIATGVLDERGGQAGFAQRLAAVGIHDSLRGAAQRGFEASANLLGRNYASVPTGSTAIPGALGDTAVGDGSEELARVGSVPEVAKMTADEANSTLSNAGYAAEEVAIDIGSVQPPYDRVIATKPAAGTTLPRGSRVQYLLPRAWVARGNGRLTANDQDTRLGFDFDTGKYIRIDEGAEIYSTSQAITVASPYANERNKIRTTIHVNPKALMVRALPPEYGTYATTHYLTYEDCERSFREPLPDPSPSGAGEYCIATDGGRTARVSISGTGLTTAVHANDGDYFFNYVLFPGNSSGRVRPLGRVYGPDGPVKSKLSICEAAKVARDRNSPAAPGLAKQCLASGGSIPSS